MFDDSGELFFTFDDIIPQNRELDIKENQAGLNNSPYMSINEVRQKEGLPAIKGGDTIQGNPFLEPIGVVVKEAPKPVQRVRKLTGKQKLMDSIDKGFDKLSDDLEEVAEKERQKILEGRHKKFVGRVSEYEKSLITLFKEFNLKQKNEVLRNLKQAVKAVTKADLFDEAVEITAVIDFATPLLKELSKDQINSEWAKQAFEGDPDVQPERMITSIDRSTKKMAKSYNATTLDLLTKKINAGIVNGDSLIEITKSIEQIYEFNDSVRAKMVARSETFNVANESSKEAYKQSGVVETVRWFTAEDEKVCQWCGPLDGKIFGVDEKLFKKGSQYEGSDGGVMKLDYRSIAHPPLHPSCRCFIQPETINF